VYQAGSANGISSPKISVADFLSNWTFLDSALSSGGADSCAVGVCSVGGRAVLPTEPILREGAVFLHNCLVVVFPELFSGIFPKDSFKDFLASGVLINKVCYVVDGVVDLHKLGNSICRGRIQ
jgi:hypothetical protein